MTGHAVAAIRWWGGSFRSRHAGDVAGGKGLVDIEPCQMIIRYKLYRLSVRATASLKLKLSNACN
jgi:hypothetical protein